MVQKKEETYQTTGERLLEKVKELIKEGNVRKITIQDKKGKTIAEFPLTVGVIGAVVVPVLAAVGAMAALISDCTITVVREDESPQKS